MAGVYCPMMRTVSLAFLFVLLASAGGSNPSGNISDTSNKKPVSCNCFHINNFHLIGCENQNTNGSAQQATTISLTRQPVAHTCVCKFQVTIRRCDQSEVLNGECKSRNTCSLLRKTLSEKPLQCKMYLPRSGNNSVILPCAPLTESNNCSNCRKYPNSCKVNGTHYDFVCKILPPTTTTAPTSATTEIPSSVTLNTTTRAANTTTLSTAAMLTSGQSDPTSSTSPHAATAATPASDASASEKVAGPNDDNSKSTLVMATIVSIVVACVALVGICVLVFFLLRRKQCSGLTTRAAPEAKQTAAPENGPGPAADPANGNHSNEVEMRNADLSDNCPATASAAYDKPCSRLSQHSVHIYSELGDLDNDRTNSLAAFEPMKSLYRLARAPDETAKGERNASNPYEIQDNDCSLDDQPQLRDTATAAAAEYKKLDFSGKLEAGPVVPSAPPAESHYNHLNGGAGHLEQIAVGQSVKPNAYRVVKDEAAAQKGNQADVRGRGDNTWAERHGGRGQRREGNLEGGLYHILEGAPSDTSRGDETTNNVYHVLEGEEGGPASVTALREGESVYNILEKAESTSEEGLAENLYHTLEKAAGHCAEETQTGILAERPRGEEEGKEGRPDSDDYNSLSFDRKKSIGGGKVEDATDSVYDHLGDQLRVQ